MPTYEYESSKYGVVFETTQRITSDAFKTAGELKRHMIANGDLSEKQMEDLAELCKQDNQDEDSEYNTALYECLMDEEAEVHRLVSGGVGVIFKGLGWPSQTFKSMKYTGKNKKQVERMREERAAKRKTGLSTPELASSLGVQGKVTDNVITNDTWDRFSKADQKKLRQIGARPSRDYT